MELITKHQIDHFLNTKTMAIAGASRDEKSFSSQVAVHLSKLGYKLWLINPQFDPSDKENNRIQSVSELPSDVTHLLVLTPAVQTESVVTESISKGIKNLWIQQYSDTPNALKLARENGLNLVHHQCIFMFSQPEGMHKFHHRIKKFFGGIPK
jgi:predicted CoA-binding protein